MVSLRALFKLQPSQVRKEEHNHQVKAIVQGKEGREESTFSLVVHLARGEVVWEMHKYILSVPNFSLFDHTSFAFLIVPIRQPLS